eukprot:6198163-Pleurochrysis_carterae.AAC.2
MTNSVSAGWCPDFMAHTWDRFGWAFSHSSCSAINAAGVGTNYLVLRRAHAVFKVCVPRTKCLFCPYASIRQFLNLSKINSQRLSPKRDLLCVAEM